MKKLTVYLDTSVINFLFAEDAPEKKEVTEIFFEKFVRLSIYDVFISDVVLAELTATSDVAKRDKLVKVIKDYPINYVDIQNSPDIDFLVDLYLSKGIKKKEADALHVAISTLNRIDVLLTWNYQHLANVNREKRIIAENMNNNYWHNLRLLTPLELIGDE